MSTALWKLCLTRLEDDLSAQQFNTWIRPLHAVEHANGLTLLAPNRFVRDFVDKEYLGLISSLATTFSPKPAAVRLDIGSEQASSAASVTADQQPAARNKGLGALGFEGRLNPAFTFETHVVKALQHNAINEFKRFYRSLDALLIDDIQFFSGKEHSQEEFFHTFNTLLEGQRQVVITSDRFPREISGVQERLISRFGSGLTVPIDPPELETRMAILKNKAQQKGVGLPEDVCFFVAKQIRSNVRELEGALHRIIASANFTGRNINTGLAREALRDLLVFQERQVTIQNIQKVVAEYFKMRISDLHSKRRNRQITRPRQIAMALAKELTPMSLPEIGDAFGGRDHTTVLHAQRKIAELVKTDPKISEDYQNLHRLLGG